MASVTQTQYQLVTPAVLPMVDYFCYLSGKNNKKLTSNFRITFLLIHHRSTDRNVCKVVHVTAVLFESSSAGLIFLPMI